MATEYSTQTNLTVGVVDAVTNSAMRDVVGNKEDAEATSAGTTKSIIAYLKGLLTNIAGLSLLTAKEKSLLGIGFFPGFQDFFNTVTYGGDPSTTYWSVTENSGSVTVENASTENPGWVRASSGSLTDNDGVLFSNNKMTFSLKDGVTTIHIKTRIKFNFQAAATGQSCCFGVMANNVAVAYASRLSENGAHEAAIIVVNSIPTAYSGDGDGHDTTDLSAYISDDTWFDCYIVISVTDVKFYIDGTLRATHSTNVPAAVWQIVLGATCIGSSYEHSYMEYIQVWAE